MLDVVLHYVPQHRRALGYVMQHLGAKVTASRHRYLRAVQVARWRKNPVLTQEPSVDKLSHIGADNHRVSEAIRTPPQAFTIGSYWRCCDQQPARIWKLEQRAAKLVIAQVMVPLIANG